MKNKLKLYLSQKYFTLEKILCDFSSIPIDVTIDPVTWCLVQVEYDKYIYKNFVRQRV